MDVSKIQTAGHINTELIEQLLFWDSAILGFVILSNPVMMHHLKEVNAPGEFDQRL